MTVQWRADRQGAKRHSVKALSSDTEQMLIQRMFSKATFDLPNAILVDENYQPLGGRTLEQIGFASGQLLIMQFRKVSSYDNSDPRFTSSNLRLM